MTKYLVVSYGKGGHQEQMSRLLISMYDITSHDVRLLILTDSHVELKSPYKVEKVFYFSEPRDKHSRLLTLFKIPLVFFHQLFVCIRVVMWYQCSGIISTGPGVSILPSIIFRCLNKKVVSFESWSRFSKPSLTAILIAPFSNLFFVQNLSIKKEFKKSLYKGRL